jgi:hypothetical protein
MAEASCNRERPMTESEWLACKSPEAMLSYVLGGELAGGPRRLLAEARAGKRKLRLFACACCRRIWHLIPDEASRQLVQVAERYVDGLVTNEQLVVVSNIAAERISDRDGCPAYFSKTAAMWAGKPGGQEFREEDVCDSAVKAAAFDTGYGMRLVGGSTSMHFDPMIEETEYQTHCSYLRDIFGNPFRPVTIDAAWLASTVISLAQAIYEERAFDRLPILVDALEDAGCTNADVLDHCRQPGDHVQGCFVVDLLLGKK